ncbi:MAG: hypothetical protein R3F53_05335 [Gammaproteobacteria bacterium]
MKFESNLADIRRTLELLHPAGTVFEIRILKTGRKKTVRGYFDNVDAAAKNCHYWNGKAPAIYVTLNPVNPALLARSANRLESYAETTTVDTDIPARRWLLVDCDPVRPSGISSSDAEHAAALERIKSIRAALQEQGWPQPVAADSGNGGHLLYRIELPNNPASGQLVQRCLQALAQKFDDEQVTVDTSVFNAARITKIYGTLARKGDSTPERPHRLARLLNVPETVTPVPHEQLQALAAQFVEPAEKPKPARQSPAGNGYFEQVNAAAMQQLAVWVPALFDAKARPYKQGFRVRSTDLNRSLEEDLSLQPGGIRDFGTETGLTPVDTVLAFGSARTALDAANWLAEQLGIERPQRTATVTPIKTRQKRSTTRTDKSPERPPFYAIRYGCMTHLKPNRDASEPVPVPLCNFTAEIIEDAILDDGSGEPKRLMTVSGKLAGGHPLPKIEIESDRFANMNWVSARWGSRAIVYAGMAQKDHLRAAIQWLSSPTERHIYAHTGWRQMAGEWCYLHQAGAISATGNRQNVEVELLGSLAGYALPAPHPDRSAISASVQLLAIAPLWLSAPVFLGVYRAVLTEMHPVDFSLFLAGATGCRKSELAALAQAHYGPEFHGKHLPASWSSTGNALERLAFTTKDALLTIDDFAPGGNQTDVNRLHRDADRILRAQGNRAGRARMKGDGGLQATYHPRGLILATGEDIPRGQSVRARLLIFEMDGSSVDLGVLTQLQAHARAGLLAQSLALFIQWCAKRMDELKTQLPARARELRGAAAALTAHSRTPDIVASLYLAAEVFAAFAAEQGVELGPDWLARIWTALLAAGERQGQFQHEQEPASRFVELIRAALSSGRAHLAPVDEPDKDTADAAYGNERDGALGWRIYNFGSGEYARTEWHSQGARIGWYDGDDIFLHPENAYTAAKQLAQDQGETLPVAQRTMAKRLLERGLLATYETDGSHKRALTRKTINRTQRRVLHFLRATVVSDSGLSGLSGLESNKNNEIECDFEDRKEILPVLENNYRSNSDDVERI